MARGIGVDGLQRFGPTTPEFDVGVTNPSTPSPDGAGGNSMVDPGAYPEPGHGVEDAVGGRDDQPGPAGTSGSTPAQTVLPSDAPVPDLAAIRQAAEPTNLEDLLNLDLDHLELGIIAGDASDPGQDRGGDLAGVVDDIDSVVDEVVLELDLPGLSDDGDTGDPARDGLDLSDPIGPIVDVPDVDIPLLGDSNDGDGPASDGPDVGAPDAGASDDGASDAGASDSSGDDLLDTDLLTGDDGVIGGLFGGDPAG